MDVIGQWRDDVDANRVWHRRERRSGRREKSLRNGRGAEGSAPRDAIDFEDGGAFVLEKTRLAAPGDDDVEQVQPLRALVLADRPGAQVVHHDVREVPQRVREQENFFPGGFQRLEHGHERVVGVNERRRVVRDRALQRPVPVTQVHARADLVVDLVERLRRKRMRRVRFFHRVA
eukprot:29148-Pelagococcus_subviridis.AAC.3